MERLQKECGKITIYGDKLVFKNSGKIFTLRGDALEMITGYKFNTTESPDAKLIIKFMDEMHFDTQGKSTRDKNLIKNYFNKSDLLASGLQEVIFLSEDANELRDRLCLIVQ